MNTNKNTGANMNTLDLGAGDLVRVGMAYTLQGPRHDGYTSGLWYVATVHENGDVGLTRTRVTGGLWAPDLVEVWINHSRLTRID